MRRRSRGVFAAFPFNEFNFTPIMLVHWRHYYTARWHLWRKNPAAAAREYQNALALKPDFWLATAALGHLQARERRFPDAVRSFERALALKPNDADILFNLGFVQAADRHDDDAILNFERAVAANPSHDRAWYGMGLSWAHKGDHAKAVDMFKKAAELQPFNPHAQYQLAMANHALGHPEEVKKILRRVSTFDPVMTRQIAKETGLPPPS
jgi:tetratricopeptide (TPR) repeat protein